MLWTHGNYFSHWNMLLSFRYSSGQRKNDFDLGAKNMSQKLPDRPQTLAPSSQIFYPGCDSPGNCAGPQAWAAHEPPVPGPQQRVTSALQTVLMSFHWGGFLMALNANLRIFACDLISHGAPRGWVTSAPGAERFFFPLEAPACGIMWFCKIFSFSLEARFPPRLLQKSHSSRLGKQQTRAKNAFCLKMLDFKMNLMNFECFESGNADVDEWAVLM